MTTQALTRTRAERSEYALPIVLRMSPVIRMTEKQFLAFCEMNDELRIERTAGGELVIMPPAGMYSSSRNIKVSARLYDWARQDGAGVAFDSSVGFTLPNGAMRSPDASWILKTRLAELTGEDKDGFGHICPDFVVELRSRSDRLIALRAKMDEYMANGARLGWLIDPRNRRVYVYRPNRDAEVVENPDTVSGEPELAGFTLELADVWGRPF